MKKDLERLKTFLSWIPDGARAAFEFRHESWHDEDVFAALRERNAALCISHADEESGALETPFVATADWAYLRLRKESYDPGELEEWAACIASPPGATCSCSSSTRTRARGRSSRSSSRRSHAPELDSSTIGPMERARFEAIVRRPDEESARDAYPSDFPARIDVPAARYVDPGFLALEKAHVFETCWLYVAHTDQLPAAGDYLMLDALDRIGHPLFLLRGSDGAIRAFYNACRHRGGPLVDAPSGSAGVRLVCKYHAWTYDFEGRLVGFPEAKNFPHDAKDDCPALRQVACDTWGPFVFVRLSERGPTLREHLEPVASELDGVFGDRSSGVHFAGAKALDVACNWKAPGDGNIETYHVPFVHRNSAALAIDEKRTGQWLLPQGHSRMLIRFRFELPAELALPRFAGDTSLAELGVYSFHVFPNLSIVLGGPNFGLMIATYPDGVGRCRYYTHFISPVPRTDETSARIDASVAGNWAVLLEDLANQTAAQKSMECGALESLRLQYQERRIRYVHEEIDRRIGPERIARAPARAGAARPLRREGVTMEPFVALMRRYCIDYTNSHDQSVCDEIMEPEYVVHISGFDLPRDAAYKPAVTGVFARFPGLAAPGPRVRDERRSAGHALQRARRGGRRRGAARRMGRHRPVPLERAQARRELRRAGLPGAGGAARERRVRAAREPAPRSVGRDARRAREPGGGGDRPPLARQGRSPRRGERGDRRLVVRRARAVADRGADGRGQRPVLGRRRAWPST